MSSEPNISGFWTWFATHQDELLAIIGGRASGRITERLDQALAENGLKLAYEVTESGLGAELSFTPQGDPALARFIDRVVASAPTFSAWVIFGRIQRKALSAALAFVRTIHGIDLSDVRFKTRFLDDRYHLCFLHDALHERPEEERLEVAGTFLDHALGEHIVMEYVGHLEFRPAGAGIEVGLLVNEIVVETGDLEVIPAPAG